MSYFNEKNKLTPNSISAWALPQTPLGELTALPQGPDLIAGLIWSLLLRKGKRWGRQGREGRVVKERRREGKGGETQKRLQHQAQLGLNTALQPINFEGHSQTSPLEPSAFLLWHSRQIGLDDNEATLMRLNDNNYSATS